MRMAWILAPIAAVSAGVGALAWSAQDASTPAASPYRQLELFADVLVRVRSEYVTDVNDAEMMEAAIQGMLTSLDPHSAYLPPEDFSDMQVETRGEYGGLGIEVTMEEGVVKVITPMDDTPASRAGLKAGDYITGINGQSIIGLNVNDAVDRMRGPVGTDITLTIAREGVDPFEVTLTRELINMRAVTARVEDGVAIVRVSRFNDKTGDMLNEAVRRLRREQGARLKGLVLDLRNNPGGLLDQAIEVADAFLDGGEVVSTRGRRNNDIERYNARRGELFPGLQVVVLINEGSASASEIVAGALQDRGRALVVGTTSFGKGSVQTIIPLKGGRDGALRLTTARYYTPSGRSIQGAGIDPDMEVAQARIDPEKLKRPVFTEADLPGALENEDGAERRGPHVPEDQPPEGWDAAKDYQLQRAMELLTQGVVAERLEAKRQAG